MLALRLGQRTRAPSLLRSFAMSQAWRPVSSPEHDVYATPIQRSPNDDRDYRIIRLKNGLHAMLIHDPNVDKAAASLAVTVGHLSDPDDMPGLAHFCEHLLFMGTEQFPRENEYGEYISSHGGHTNAYTSSSDTNYFFSVGSDALPGALERFSGFFHSPLLDASCTTRELSAVDSEHKKNLQSDSWRLFQMSKSLSKPGHVWAKFGSGNMVSLTQAARAVASLDRERSTGTPGRGDSLAPTPAASRMPSPAPSLAPSENEPDGGAVGRETRRRLVEWWKSHYCASRMNLVILGKEPLDELTRLAIENFSPVPNRSLPTVKDVPELPWGEDHVGKFIHAKTIMDFQAVELQFQLPSQYYHWRSKPSHFIAHLIGHEGPGSLHSYLKQKGLLVRLSCGNQPQARGIDFFKITAFLTPEGFKRYREVVLTMCKYLNLLRDTSSFPIHLFNELKVLAETRFNFAEKRTSDSYVSALSEQMQRPFPPENVLSGNTLLWDWDEPLVRRILAELLPEKGRVIVMAKDYAPLGLEDPSVKWDQEKWYKTTYNLQDMDDAFLMESRKPNDLKELYLPPKNDYMPTNLAVDKCPVDKPLKRAEVVRKTPLSILWHKKDDQFWVPKANVFLFIRSPMAAPTPRHIVKTRLFCELVTDALTEVAYAAELASLRYDFSPDVYGVQVSLSGYNDKLPVLLETVLRKIKTIEINPGRFADMKEDLRQEWANFRMSQPVELADYYARFTLSELTWPPDERLAELETVTLEEVHRHAQELLSRVKIEAFVHGNITQTEAVALMETSESILGARPLAPSEQLSNRSHVLPPNAKFVYQMDVPNVEDVNSGLSYYLHVGDITDKQLRAKLNLLAHIIHEPVFDQLRTKQQLGYIVQSAMIIRTGIMGLRIHIQSERSPAYLEQRVDAFLEGYKDMLSSMSEQDFEKQKNGLIMKKLEKCKNLAEEASRLWSAIDSGYHDFLRREIDVETLRTLSKEDMIDFVSTYFLPSSPERRKLSIHLKGRPKVDARFSVAASQAFLPILKEHGVPVTEADYTASSAAEPPVDAVKEFWKNTLEGMPNVSAESARVLIENIERLALAHPVQVVAATDALPEGTVLIPDLAQFKLTLPLSAAATPVSS
ncbi:hypothetical protein EXIGLDRAFT_747787 [Exidia glandulosa HHB12029]|uniref:Insulin-degrading enzyme n=1 Tax=Exidia glandulosa HHB12029 TaxID=1314781 RepID=A0A165KEC7_EXIGL|nr:hypothetical protein EXIGLDRAFT_747787 [Exidia glandulosa HHB12029]